MPGGDRAARPDSCAGRSSTSWSSSAATTRRPSPTSCCRRSPSTGATRVQHEPFTQEHLDAMPPGLAIAEVANVPEVEHDPALPQRAGAAPDHGARSRPASTPPPPSELPAGKYGDHGIPHGWGFILQQVLGGDRRAMPFVPVFVNTFWQPTRPAPALLRLRRRARRGDRELPRRPHGRCRRLRWPDPLRHRRGARPRRSSRRCETKRRRVPDRDPGRRAAVRHLRAAATGSSSPARWPAARLTREGRRLPAVLPLRGRHRLRHGVRRLGRGHLRDRFLRSTVPDSAVSRGL